VLASLLLTLGLLAWVNRPTTAAPGDMTVTIHAGYNLVVDSNVLAPSTYAPRVATVAGKICNNKGTDMTNVTAYIGTFTNTTSFSPGLYPIRYEGVGTFNTEHPQLAAATVSTSSPYSFTHVGGRMGLGDASRFIGTIPANTCVYQYWHFAYPQVDAEHQPGTNSGEPVWGLTRDPNDDLWLNFDIWAVGDNGGASDNKRWKMTMRNEISAMANKIQPNPDGVWFNTNTNTIRPGGLITTNGILYTYGNVNFGFDNDLDLIPDFNAWSQPIGDASFDPSCFRLVKTSGLLIISRSSGQPDVIIPFVNQLYFTNMPSDNTNVTANVFYTFMAIDGPCSTALSPYQEAASGYDNEKFNGDYGVSIPRASSSSPEIAFTKSGTNTVTAGARMTYTLRLTNTNATESFGAGITLGGFGAFMPPVISDSIPNGTIFVTGTASGSVSTGGVVTVRYLTDTTVGFTTTQPATGTKILQWWMPADLPGGAVFTATFAITAPTSAATPFITNTACVQLDGGPSMVCSPYTTTIKGSNTIGDYVWQDRNLDQVQGDTTSEPYIEGVTVTLYYDSDGSGTYTAGDILLSTTQTGPTGYYTFTEVADGNYVVVVDENSPNIPFGYSATTDKSVTVTGLGTRFPTPYAFRDADFGFGPVLILDKVLLQSNPAWEGDLLTYTIRLTNTRLGDGTGTPAACAKTAIFWTTAISAASSGWNVNALAAGAPDQKSAFSTITANPNDDLTAMLITPTVTGTAISKIEAVFMLTKTGEFDDQGSSSQQDILRADILSGSATVGYQFNTTYISNTYNNATSALFAVDVSGLAGSAFPPSTMTWTSFSRYQITVHIEKGNDNAPRAFAIDAMGWRVTYTGTCGTPDDTLNPVPVSDTYDANQLQFVSATPLINSSSTTGSGGSPYTNTGTLTWTNVGPLYAGGYKVITVTFRALEPYSPTTAPNQNVSTTITNTAWSYDAKYISGKPTNQVSDSVRSVLYPTGMIGDFIWRDLNSNGMQDGGEEVGIPGVVVSLTAHSVFTVAGVEYPAFSVVTTTTDANGYYYFTGIRGITVTYGITVDTATIPSLGTVTQTGDPDQPGVLCTVCNNAHLMNYNPIARNNVLTVDFGYNLPGLIAGSIWNDWNRSGASTPDAGEEYIGGISLTLKDSTGAVISATTADANGYYEFVGNFAAGSYTVTVADTTAPLDASWTQSFDKDGHLATPHTISVTFTAAGQSRLNQDFSYYQDDNAAIGDTVYNDLDGNGLQTGLEPGLSGVRVWLYEDQNGDGTIDPSTDTLMMTATTNSTGFYQFTDLGETTGSQRYIVRVDTSTLPGTDYYQSGDPDETGACAACDSMDQGISLTPSQNYDTADFGYRRSGTGSIGDTVFKDSNGDGYQNTGESGISAITVRLYISGVNVLTATSSITGYYNFPNLPSGTYTVSVDEQDSDLPTDSYNNRYILSTNNNPLTVVLAGGEHYRDADFGFAPPGAIGDSVYWDYDQDGEQDYTDPGISGVQVILTNTTTFISGGVTYAPGAFSLIATTDASGIYSFTGLMSATYKVRVNIATFPGGTPVQTGDPDKTESCLVSTTYCDNELTFNKQIQPGTYFWGADFGYRNTSVIGNFVFRDLNQNGMQDPGEPGISGVTVTVVNTTTGIPIYTTTTDIGGFYSFSTTNLAAGGVYSVMFTNPTGMVPVTNTSAAITGVGSVGNNITFTLSATNTVNAVGGTACTNCGLYLDAGYRTAGTGSITGTVFFDGGGGFPTGGVFGASDTPFSQTTVYLWDSSGKLVGITTTNSSGFYQFPSLADGSYTVSVGVITSSVPLTWTSNPPGGTAPTANLCTQADQGTALCDNRSGTITVSGSPVPSQDFGLYSSMDCDDLPDSYGTYFNSGKGACHTITSNVFLGTAPTTEADGKPSSGASLDTDDGISWPTGGPNRWVIGGPATVTVNVGGGGSGYVVGWLDWNNDGDFNDEDEQVYEGTLGAGNNTVTFTVSPDFNPSVNTSLYMRWRVYPSEPTLVSAALVTIGGEVEGWRIPFSPTAVELAAFDATAVDRWWWVALTAGLVALVIAAFVAARRWSLKGQKA
jgi:hypothetical protein